MEKLQNLSTPFEKDIPPAVGVNQTNNAFVPLPLASAVKSSKKSYDTSRILLFPGCE